VKPHWKYLVTLFIAFYITPTSVAYAALISVNMTGEVTFVETQLNFIEEGSPFSVSYIVDTSFPVDTLENLDIGRYYAITSLTINLNGESWEGDSSAYIQIIDRLSNNFFYPEEQYSIVDFGVSSNSSLSDLFVFTVFSNSMSTNELNGIDLVAAPPFSPSDYTFRVLYGSLNDNVTIDGRVNQITVSSVVEPQMITLLIAVVAFTLYSQRRKHRELPLKPQVK